MSHKGTISTPVSFSGNVGTGVAPSYVAGDRLYAIVSQDSPNATITAPTGWPNTPIATLTQTSPDGQTVLVYEIKSATGTESMTWNSTAVNVGLITISAYDGRHATAAATFVTPTINTTSQASPISITDIAGGTAAAGDDVFMYIGTDQQSGGAVWTESGLSSGLTERASQAASAWTCGMLSSVDAVSAGTFGPVSVTLTGTTGNTGYHAVVIAIPAASGGGGPSISSTSSATPQRGSTLTVTGSNFGASQGTQVLKVGGVTQTVTSWAAGSITLANLDIGTNKYGVPVNVEIWDGGSLVSNSFALTSLQPPAGNSFKDIVTPNTTSAYRITTSPVDVASGDQIEATLSAQVTLFDDATFSAVGTVQFFQARAWSSSGGGWGDWTNQVLIDIKASKAQFDRHMNLKGWF